MYRRLSLFNIINTAFLGFLCLLVIVPFLYMIAVSISPSIDSMAGQFYLIPKSIDLSGYKFLMGSQNFIRSLSNTVYITVVGVAVNLFFSISLAYAISKKFVPGRRLVLLMVLFTMLFGGGMIPSYLLVKSLGLLNTYWAIILPGATNAFTILVMKTFFQNLPESLDEAARIDGAGEIKIIFALVLPLSMPIIATFSLFFMVSHWNEFFGAVIYINNPNKWPIQVFLRLLVVLNNMAGMESEILESEKLGENVKMAAIIIAMIPIVAVYPFLQKYFAQGSMLGSVKE